ncbi:MAG: hypothetical protein U1E21_18270 [Reyranellaceae bacterium]
MSIEFTKVEASTRPAFYETLLMFWSQRWEEEFQREFLDWRYARRTDGETLIAMSGSKCIGLVDTFIRPYRIGGEEVLVREPCDWYCLPGNRGVGMRLMKYLIAQGEPLLGVGLPKAAIAIAPRLNWTHLLDAQDFLLPITARRLAGAILRRARLGDGAVARYLPRGIRLRPSSIWTRHREMDGEVEDVTREEWTAKGGASVDGGEGYAIAPIVTASYSQWLKSGPASLGKVFCLAFRVKGALVGMSICRIEASKVGRKARLIHVQASEPDVKRLRWMIAENVHRAIELDAESFHCRSSCPVTKDALMSLRFHPTSSSAVMVGFNGLPIPAGSVNVTYLRGDDAMIPSLIGE